jgi:Double zinc ribbon
MSETSRPNFFILLDLDPNQAWNDSFFTKRLDEKRAEWTRKQRNPKDALKYAGYMRLVPQIKTVMSDVAKRSQEAGEAIKQKSQDAQKWREEFSNHLKLIAAKGYITDDEIANLIKPYTGKITEKEVHDEIRKQSIEIRSKTATNGEIEDYLDSSEMDRIKKNLDFLGKKDLYDFLDAAKASRTEDLRQRADSIYRQNQAKSDKSPEVTASSALVGDAQKNFKDNVARARYDRSLARDKFEVILGSQVKKIIETSPEKLIPVRQFEYLLETARSENLDIDRASDFIRERAIKMSASVEVSTQKEEVKNKLVCINPSCRKVNDSKNNACTNCGTPLKISCPNCGTISPVENRACPKCSFPIGNLFNVRSLIADSKQLINVKDYDNAAVILKMASGEWSTIPPRPINDDLTQEISQLLQQVTIHQNQQKTLLEQLSTAINERRFYTARKMLGQIAREFGVSELNRENDRINAAIKKAEAELQVARELKKKGSDSVELYQNILRECKDCQEALEALIKIPPAPPSALSASVGNKIVNLSWKSSPAKNIRYTVVRKYSSPPISANDGEQLATVAGTVYEDTKPEVGRPLYYAVYTNRENVLSTTSTQLNKPVMLTEDVSNVVAQVANQQVSITWEISQYACDVLVFRSSEYQPNQKNGQRLEVVNKSKILDKNLENNKAYYYTIYALFKNSEGDTVYSQGTAVRAIPEEPPEIIETLQIGLDNSSPERQLKLSWMAPSKGEVAIFSSNKLLNFKKGNIIPQNQISRDGKLLLSNTHKNEVIIPIKETEVLYFTPVVLFQDMAYIGETVQYVNVEDVSNLRCQKQRDELQLKWDWPQSCQQVLVGYSHDGFPASQGDNGVVSANVTRTQYDLLGYFPIKNLVSRDYYIVAKSVMVQNNGQTIVASGLSNSARCRVNMTSDVSLQYTIKRKRKLFAKDKLILEITAVGKGEIPELLLVGKPRGAPLRKEDGDIILRIPKFLMTEKSHVISFDIADRTQSYGKLFLVDDSFYKVKGGYVRIDHPSLENMQVFIK